MEMAFDIKISNAECHNSKSKQVWKESVEYLEFEFRTASFEIINLVSKFAFYTLLFPYKPIINQNGKINVWQVSINWIQKVIHLK